MTVLSLFYHRLLTLRVLTFQIWVTQDTKYEYDKYNFIAIIDKIPRQFRKIFQNIVYKFILHVIGHAKIGKTNKKRGHDNKIRDIYKHMYVHV